MPDQTILRWSSRFPLRDAFLWVNPAPGEPRGGIYLWGFNNGKHDVIWYVGKAATSKGVYPRLRKHYLDIMSGQYQIPRGFLNGKFETVECSQSGWQIDAGDTDMAKILQSWGAMERIYKAGHAFANEAFARVALADLSKDDLGNVERAAISQLSPVINKQRGAPRANFFVRFDEDHTDPGWVERWQQSR
jgi:hypothetical protein